jgi:hypothetical protein
VQYSACTARVLGRRVCQALRVLGRRVRRTLRQASHPYFAICKLARAFWIVAGSWVGRGVNTCKLRCIWWRVLLPTVHPLHFKFVSAACVTTISVIPSACRTNTKPLWVWLVNSTVAPHRLGPTLHRLKVVLACGVECCHRTRAAFPGVHRNLHTKCSQTRGIRSLLQASVLAKFHCWPCSVFSRPCSFRELYLQSFSLSTLC